MNGNIHRKVANENHEDCGRYTTRSTSRHGVGKGQRWMKRYVNRRGKRAEAREDLRAEAVQIDLDSW